MSRSMLWVTSLWFGRVRFALKGTPSGTAFISGASTALDQALDLEDVAANVITAEFHKNPAVAMRPDGSFIVVWDSTLSYGGDTSGTSIQARRFRADGTPLDATEFQVNTFSTQFQRRPAVAATPAGDFVVVWDSVFTPGDGDYGIEARRYAADGTPLDPTEAPGQYLHDGDAEPAGRWQGGPMVASSSYGAATDQRAEIPAGRARKPDDSAPTAPRSTPPSSRSTATPRATSTTPRWR